MKIIAPKTPVKDKVVHIFAHSKQGPSVVCALKVCTWQRTKELACRQVLSTDWVVVIIWNKQNDTVLDFEVGQHVFKIEKQTVQG